MGRGAIIWGLILLAAGGLQFASALGYRLPGGASPSDLFWPALLVLVGVRLMMGRRTAASRLPESAEIGLSDASEASVTLLHGAGNLRIHAGARTDNLAQGRFAGGLRTTTNRQGSRLVVQMKPGRPWWDFPFPGRIDRLDWDVAFNSNIPMSLLIRSAANKATIDLQQLRVTHLTLRSGASDTCLALPARGRASATITVGAALLEVRIPGGVAARIKIDRGASSVEVDRRFQRLGAIYRSADFDSAPNAIDVEIHAGAAEIRIV
jgi:hypothetical protein